MRDVLPLIMIGILGYFAYQALQVAQCGMFGCGHPLISPPTGTVVPGGFYIPMSTQRGY